jgi:hypothetical protein
MIQTEEKQYKITKERCQQVIDEHPVVCSCCGGPLQPLETVDNSGDPTYWSGCNFCQRFDWGVSVLVFQIANKMVREGNFAAYSHDYFPHNGTPEQKECWYRSQTGGACSTVRRILKLKQEIDGNI